MSAYYRLMTDDFTYSLARSAETCIGLPSLVTNTFHMQRPARLVGSMRWRHTSFSILAFQDVSVSAFRGFGFLCVSGFPSSAFHRCSS